MFLLYYAGVVALFEVLINAELTCEKKIKKREEKKKKVEIAGFGPVAFATPPAMSLPSLSTMVFAMALWHSPWPCGIRHRHVVQFFSNCTKHGQELPYISSTTSTLF